MTQTKPGKRLNADKLTFCRLVAVDNIKPAVAYEQVFRCKPRSAATLAGKLLKNVDISTEIQRLSTKVQQVVEKAAVWSKAVRMEKVQAWAELSAEEADFNTALRCVDMLNRMDGAYNQQTDDKGAAQRVQVSDAEMAEWAAQIAAAQQKVLDQAKEKGREHEL